ncbi:MAG: hypothetical protein U0T84_09040 [Chitinophagales bacterium]
MIFFLSGLFGLGIGLRFSDEVLAKLKDISKISPLFRNEFNIGGNPDPPCITKPTTSSTISIYIKTTGPAHQPVANAEVIAQKEGHGGFITTDQVHTTDFGNVSINNVLGKEETRSRVIAVNPLKTDTTIVYVKSCSGISQIDIPVNPN